MLNYLLIIQSHFGGDVKDQGNISLTKTHEKYHEGSKDLGVKQDSKQQGQLGLEFGKDQGNEDSTS